jgi:tetratricopeptide (TPR) repeat protein
LESGIGQEGISATLDQTIKRALHFAIERRCQVATLEHLLLALIDDGDARAVFGACAVDVEALRCDLISYLEAQPINQPLSYAAPAKPAAVVVEVLRKAIRPEASERLAWEALHGVPKVNQEQVMRVRVLDAMLSRQGSHAVRLLYEQDLESYDLTSFLEGSSNTKTVASFDTDGKTYRMRFRIYGTASSKHSVSVAAALSPEQSLLKANELCKSGKADLKERAYEVAVTKLCEAVRLNPAHSLAWQLLGSALAGTLDVGNLRNTLRNSIQGARAIAAYQESIRLDPKCPEPHRGIGFVLFTTSEDEPKKLDEAVGEFLKALELKPDGEGALQMLGIVLGRKRDLELHRGKQIDVLELENRRRRCLSNQALAFHALGRMFFERGNYDSAVAAYRRALDAYSPAVRGKDEERYYSQLGPKQTIMHDLKAAESALEIAARQGS